MMLPSLVGLELTNFLEQLEIPRFHTYDDIESKMLQWKSSGAEVKTLGRSKEGRAIDAVVVGEGQKTVLLWGYPHPDEPYGAEAIIALFDALLDGRITECSGWRFVGVVCADPDEMNRQRWLAGTDRSVENFLAGAWRPTHIGYEVDYGFALEWGPFCYPPSDFVGRCRTKSECLRRCGPSGCKETGKPYAPLPESIALSNAIRTFKPELVGSLHSTHTGGDYTFLLRREKDDVLAQLTSVPELSGTGRHFGEPIDRGKHWKRYTPDLIKERSLAWQKRWIESQKEYAEGTMWVMNHSAAQFVESVLPNAQFFCAETTQFRHPNFSDRSHITDTINAMVSTEDRKNGRYKVVRVLFNGEWKVAQQIRADNEKLSDPRLLEVPVTRSILGSLAVFKRRKALVEMEKIWQRFTFLPGAYDHPYPDMKAAITTPPEYVANKSLFIFRTAEQYRRIPTKAQAASFEWLWPIHTATFISNFRNFLFSIEQTPEVEDANRDLFDLQKSVIADLPAQMRKEGLIEPAIQSILARMFVLMMNR